ncbi:hypothetical protein BT96DRAFT_943820 [Gymnopus androsaceus JB14]|uniref:Uncharacterized protein n=1 Tax=Gymnopus androsaceus JB14 TaxID=1447944 RepID=A0A6A4H5P9_9AGAR|nr:hypothetical protein BT96DRAFT_943820 [Gymnopus androsaceus JB14]
MRIEEGFQQVPLNEGNPYLHDPVLPSLLRRLIPSKFFTEIESELERFGADVITTICAQGKLLSPPKLIQYDNWGQWVDELQTSEGWRNLKAIAQREGILGIFYERTYREYSRLFGFSKVLIMSGDSHEVFCLLSMTDGAARAGFAVCVEIMFHKIFDQK